ncbi:MAG: hypothetical protein JWR74_1920 [Polaromonas sp.]|jgi:hypothetical protein|nr:hypothetical protein [Polaromonas sp.]
MNMEGNTEMHQQPRASMALLVALAGAAALAGCAGLTTGGKPPDASSEQAYRCAQNLQFTVRFANDTAVLKGARGDDVLLRDAGGQGTQTVYSNPRMRAEFGLGAGGREAVLQYLPPAPLAVRCQRD